MQPYTLQEFHLGAGQTTRFQGLQAGIILPLFKRCGDFYVDATGDYDLKMTLDGKTFEITNTSAFDQLFAYRYRGSGK
jgi:hypothetical protein